MTPTQNNLDMDTMKKAWQHHSDFPKLLENVLMARRKVKKVEEKLSGLPKAKALSECLSDEESMAEVLLELVGKTYFEAMLEYYKVELEIWCCFARFNKVGIEKGLDELKERGSRVMENYEEIGLWREEEYRKFCKNLKEMIDIVESGLKDMEEFMTYF